MYALFRKLEMVPNSPLYTSRILVPEAFQDSGMPVDRLEGRFPHVEALHAIPEHMPAKELAELYQPGATACAGQEIMEFGISVHK